MEWTHWKVFSQGWSSENCGVEGAVEARRDRDSTVVTTEKRLMQGGSMLAAPTL